MHEASVGPAEAEVVAVPRRADLFDERADVREERRVERLGASEGEGQPVSDDGIVLTRAIEDGSIATSTTHVVLGMDLDPAHLRREALQELVGHRDP